MKVVQPVLNRLPPPPDHLAPETAAWWKSVVADYQLEEHHLRLLQAACESWDTIQKAREAIREHGMTCTDARGIVRARPEIQIERDSKTSFRQLIRELDLDATPPPDQGTRPPYLLRNRRS